jgi:hypothetical protein
MPETIQGLASIIRGKHPDLYGSKPLGDQQVLDDFLKRARAFGGDPEGLRERFKEAEGYKEEPDNYNPYGLKTFAKSGVNSLLLGAPEAIANLGGGSIYGQHERDDHGVADFSGNIAGMVGSLFGGGALLRGALQGGRLGLGVFRAAEGASEATKAAQALKAMALSDAIIGGTQGIASGYSGTVDREKTNTTGQLPGSRTAAVLGEGLTGAAFAGLPLKQLSALKSGKVPGRVARGLWTGLPALAAHPIGIAASEAANARPWSSDPEEFSRFKENWAEQASPLSNPVGWILPTLMGIHGYKGGRHAWESGPKLDAAARDASARAAATRSAVAGKAETAAATPGAAGSSERTAGFPPNSPTTPAPPPLSPHASREEIISWLSDYNAHIQDPAVQEQLQKYRMSQKFNEEADKSKSLRYEMDPLVPRHTKVFMTFMDNGEKKHGFAPVQKVLGPDKTMGWYVATKGQKAKFVNEESILDKRMVTEMPGTEKKAYMGVRHPEVEGLNLSELTEPMPLDVGPDGTPRFVIAGSHFKKGSGAPVMVGYDSAKEVYRPIHENEVVNPNDRQNLINAKHQVLLNEQRKTKVAAVNAAKGGPSVIPEVRESELSILAHGERGQRNFGEAALANVSPDALVQSGRGPSPAHDLSARQAPGAVHPPTPPPAPPTEGKKAAAPKKEGKKAAAPKKEEKKAAAPKKGGKAKTQAETVADIFGVDPSLIQKDIDDLDKGKK